MRFKISGNVVRAIAYIIVVSGIGAGIWFSRELWLPHVSGPVDEPVPTDDNPIVDEVKVAKLNQQARANLRLVSKPYKIQTYWKKVQIPGVIVDRPGVTDRGITAPVAGVITQVHAFEGDIIQPGEKLFTLRLVSEYLQKTQSDLFKSVRETEILETEIARIRELTQSGIIPGKRILELEQQISRQSALIDAYRQDLLSRGLKPVQIERIESGKFLTTIDIFAPVTPAEESELHPESPATESLRMGADFLEIQVLKVELGQQVDAGEALAVLANHNSLYIKGHAFKKEASQLAHAAEKDWPVEVEFAEDVAKDWAEEPTSFRIRHLANTTDPASRTFDFFIPLSNQSRVYKKDGRTFVVWRYRPGQRVSIRVPVEPMENVIVLPAAAVLRKGAEAFVFQQNGDLFNRISVQLLHQDQANVVIANDGSLSPGFYLAQGSAESLNRILNAQAASGMRADVHVHADGTTHAAH